MSAEAKQVTESLNNLAVSSDDASASGSESAAKRAPTVEELRACLTDEKAPIAKRMRTVFFLRQQGGQAAIDALASAIDTPSVLLGHEIAFVLGQMLDPYAVKYLNAALENKSLNPIVRHEAAEALGAIALPESLELLEKYCNDEAHEVADTCHLALARVKYRQNAAKDKTKEEIDAEFESKYYTTDPAPAFKNKDIAELQRILCDSSLSMFERYRAMFALRNKGDKAAVLALGAGYDDKSAVFRHEIAYVFGQLQHPASAPILKKMLENKDEHPMVRHEAAEALGSIGNEECEKILKDYQSDKDRVVSESCDVALDIAEYWSSDQMDGETAVDSDDDTTTPPKA